VGLYTELFYVIIPTWRQLLYFPAVHGYRPPSAGFLSAFAPLGPFSSCQQLGWQLGVVLVLLR